MVYIGIDPGKGGGIAVVCDDQQVTFSLKDKTERDIWEFVSAYPFATCGVIERVASSPQMGVVSAFSFGKSLGFLRGVLIASGIAFDEVSPQKWQKELGCLTKGDKNKSKAKAQQLFPGVKITHANADALLLAEYARRMHLRNEGMSVVRISEASET